MLNLKQDVYVEKREYTEAVHFSLHADGQKGSYKHDREN